ncbi:MAG: hypothetical protein P8L66_01150 [Rhodospirillaceae bacterium]|nr:hypothetical protein [Rhodospirillaceae bacterium]
MLIGRAFGWTMVLAAILMASAEAVMALGTGSYLGLATGDLWALLWGRNPNFLEAGFSDDLWRFSGALLMALPAWAVLGPVGVILAHTCRRRPPNGRLFRTTLK